MTHDQSRQAINAGNITKQSGLTLVEASLWFLIYILVIGGVLKLYSSVATSKTVSLMTADVMLLRDATHQILNAAGAYGSSGTNLVPTLIAANKIPSSIIITSGTLANEQGGALLIAANGPIASGDSFVITEKALTKDVCTKLVSDLSLQGFPVIKVGSTSFSPGSTATPIPAASVCALSSSNVVVLTSN